MSNSPKFKGGMGVYPVLIIPTNSLSTSWNLSYFYIFFPFDIITVRSVFVEKTSLLCVLELPLMYIPVHTGFML